MIKGNQIINADCLDYLNKIENNSIDLILTDPPYGISINTKFHRHKSRKSKNDIMNFGNWDRFTTKWINQASQVLKKGGNFIVFTDWKKIGNIINSFELNGITPKRLLHFQKSNPVPFNRDRLIVNSCEYAIWGVKGKGWTFNRQRNNFENGIFIYPSQRKINHTTPKPLSLMEELMKIFSNKGDLVLDCFAGSGTIGIACMNLKRKFILIEKEKTYYETIRNRLKQK